jgi:hypothetical protein
MKTAKTATGELRQSAADVEPDADEGLGLAEDVMAVGMTARA